MSLFKQMHECLNFCETFLKFLHKYDLKHHLIFTQILKTKKSKILYLVIYLIKFNDFTFDISCNDCN